MKEIVVLFTPLSARDSSKGKRFAFVSFKPGISESRETSKGMPKFFSVSNCLILEVGAGEKGSINFAIRSFKV